MFNLTDFFSLVFPIVLETESVTQVWTEMKKMEFRYYLWSRQIFEMCRFQLFLRSISNNTSVFIKISDFFHFSYRNTLLLFLFLFLIVEYG